MVEKRRNKAPIQKYNEGLNEEQALAKKVMNKHILTTVRGFAGSGKTHLAVAYALEKLSCEKKHGGVDGIVITRAMVTRKEHEMGFLPGDLEDKIDPWLAPIKEIISSFEGTEKLNTMLKNHELIIAPLAFIKGRTFTNKVVLVDEASDLSRRDVEALFTRIGHGSSMIFMGDMRQCDLPNSVESGFPRLCKMAEVVDSVADVVLKHNFRSEIVKELLDNY